MAAKGAKITLPGEKVPKKYAPTTQKEALEYYKKRKQIDANAKSGEEKLPEPVKQALSLFKSLTSDAQKKNTIRDVIVGNMSTGDEESVRRGLGILSAVLGEKELGPKEKAIYDWSVKTIMDHFGISSPGSTQGAPQPAPGAPAPAQPAPGNALEPAAQVVPAPVQAPEATPAATQQAPVQQPETKMSAQDAYNMLRQSGFSKEDAYQELMNLGYIRPSLSAPEAIINALQLRP
jgi:hypothetical protein